MTEPQSYRQTMEQQRAQQAFAAIQAVEQERSYKDNYGTLARGLPAMIQVNGLAATIAFLKAKAGSGRNTKLEYLRMYEHLSQRLQVFFEPDQSSERNADYLLDIIRTASTDIYRRATAEAISYSNWLKRYVEAKGWKSSGS